MPDKNIHREDKDVFSELVKQKLENHQLPIDESLWDGIEQQLPVVQAAKKRRIVHWQWIAAGVAAVIAFALLTHKPQEITLQTPDLSLQQEQRADTGSNPVIPDKEPASYLSGIENAKNPQSAPAVSSSTAGLFSRKTKTAAFSCKSNSTSPVGSGEEEAVEEGSSLRKEESAPVEQKQETDAAKSSTKPNPYNKLDKLPDLNDYPEIPEHTERPKKKQRVLIAAALGTGNTHSNPSGIDEQQVVQRLPDRQLVKQKEVTSNFTNILNANDYSNVQHYAPLSFGVRVEVTLTGWFSLESGLTYTYLKSIFKGGGENDRGKLELHYLGIPLNVRAKIINGAKWDLYGSAGGMVEKGVYSIYDQIIENKSKKTNTRVEYTTEGLQWSLNGAVGVEYKLNKDLRLFVEPQVTYYLENNQPMSARTEQPLTLGLNGGLRVKL